jgi:hypothetical protein
MKKLLLSSILFLVSLFSFAQGDSCDNAIPITGDGIITASAISGAYIISCDQVNPDTATAPVAGNWYTFTPTANGIVDLTSNLPANVAPNSVDTRVSIWSGTCATLTCLAGNDDISGANYLSTVSFAATIGTTYYIQWDDRWDAAGFDFEFTFTPVSCFPVSVINLPTNIATSSITLNWDASTSAPASYDVEYGPLGFTQGSGTTVSTSTNSISLTGLTVSTVYDFYVRSNCGTSQSTWSAVNSFSTAKVLPYASGFDNTSSLIGWSTFGNGAYGLSAIANATLSQSPSYYWIMNNTVGAVSNNWLFTPAVSLQAGEQVTATFWLRCGTTRSLRFTVGNASTPAAQTTQIWANNALLLTSYAQQTTPVFTAPSAGIYYFAFNDISVAAAGTAATLRLDTVSMTSVLGTNDFLSSNFSVFPNPVKNVINFSNDANAVVSLVEMTDLNGRVIKSQKVNATEGQISVSDLATGMYMMKITTDQGVAVKKIVKQ